MTLKKELKAAKSYENLVAQLIGRGEKDLLKKLNLLMAYSLTPPINDDPRYDNAFVEKLDVYDRFFCKRFPRRCTLETACFITLNYDCLLERALCRCYHHPTEPDELKCLCRHINYRLHSGVSGIEVLKPHGSINWIADVTLEDQPYVQQPVVTIHQSRPENWARINIADSPQHKGHAEIALAHYAPQKAAQINIGLLKNVRDLACKRINQATSITVIGVRIPTDSGDDPFLDDFLKLAGDRAQTGCHAYFVNTSDADLLQASSRGFIPQKCTFEKYVAQMNCSK